MITPTDIIRATGSDPRKPQDPKTNPLGTGHTFHVGRVFQCAGVIVPNPRFEEDSAAGFDPPSEILVQHTIMTLLDVPADCQQGQRLPSERADEGKWDMDEAQTAMDSSNPVCQLCGQPPVS